MTVSGTGFGFCRTAWSVAIDGTPIASAPETDSTAEDRSATLSIPVDLAPGSYRVVARCDSGAGVRDAAEATLVVRGPTTTSSSSSSTTSTVPESTTTTRGGGRTTTTTSSTTTPPATDTTTAGG